MPWNPSRETQRLIQLHGRKISNALLNKEKTIELDGIKYELIPVEPSLEPNWNLAAKFRITVTLVTVGCLFLFGTIKMICALVLGHF